MPLKYRIALTIFVLEAVLMAVVLHRTQAWTLETYRVQVAANEDAMLGLLAETGRVALLRMDYSEVQPYVKRIGEDPRVLRVILVDDRNRIVASSVPAELGQSLPLLFDSGERHWRSAQIENAAGRLGAVAVELSDAAAHKAGREIRNRGLLLAGAGMSFIALVSIFMGTVLTRRLETLRRVAQRLAGGDLDARSELQGSDEVTQVGQTFDRMAERFAGTIDELERKNAQLERFTYAVSHDLKSPLFTIQGFLGVLEKDAAAGDHEALKRDAEKIRAAAGQMRRLLDELLELMRLGRTSGQVDEVDLSEVARAAAEGAGVPVEVAADLPIVQGDRRRLHEVFHHLIDNAVRFLGSQPAPRIVVACRRDGGEAVVTVRDNGIGIDPRYHEKIFGLFERLEASSERPGVGLTHVQRVIELHGGRVWVESEGAGRGSTFCFTLPPAPGLN